MKNVFENEAADIDGIAKKTMAAMLAQGALMLFVGFYIGVTYLAEIESLGRQTDFAGGSRTNWMWVLVISALTPASIGSLYFATKSRLRSRRRAVRDGVAEWVPQEDGSVAWRPKAKVAA